MDLEKGIREEVLRFLPYDKSDRRVTSDLATLSTRDLLTYFFNWGGRLIPAQPRIVHISAELSRNPQATEFEIPLSSLIRRIEQGQDINRHQSERIAIGYQSTTGKKNLAKRFNLDLLLNEWGIWHLHLSNAINQKTNFVERTHNLLFGIFTATDAYLIDILGHGNWTNTHLIEVIATNWPNADLIRELKGILPSRDSYSSFDRAKLRAAGVTTPLIVNGKAYISRTGGISLAGTTPTASITSGRLLRALGEFDRRSTDDSSFLPNLFAARGIELPPQPSLRFVIQPPVYGFLEEKTRALIPIAW